MKTSLLLAALVLGSVNFPLSAQIQTPPPANQAQAPVPQAPALTAPQGKVSQSTGAIDISQEPIVKIVANVQPAVVNITAQGTVPEYVEAYNRYFRMFHSSQSIGSGLIVSADGFVITNAHVVAMAEKEKEVNITLSSGSKYRAQIISADEDADLALLKIEDKAQFPYFDLTYTSPNLLGETVIALGSPAGYQNSVSHGILSALHRSFTVTDQGEDHTYNNLIQTDAAINPGNSGGPLIDLNGGLVGINSAKLSGTAIENIGFAIPNDVVIPWVNDAIAVAKGLKAAAAPVGIKRAEVLQKYLGITVRTLTADDASQLHLQLNGGLLITHIDGDSPASDAGLKENMVIVMIGNKQINDVKSLPAELLKVQSGTNIRLQVITGQSWGPLVLQRGGSVLLTAR